MKLLNLLLLMGLFILSINISAQAVQLTSGLEQDITFDPGVTVSFTVTLSNTSSIDTVIGLEPNLSNPLFQFLGGSYPGVGGDCTVVLNPNQSCTIFLETTPLGSGDHDNFLTFDYTLISLGGVFPPPKEQVEIKIDGFSIDSSYTIAPQIDSIVRNTIKINTNNTIKIYGSYFTPSSTISVPGLSLTNITFVSSEEMNFDVNPGSAIGLYDLVVTNEIDTLVLDDAIEVKATLWLDLRNSSDVAVANPVFDSAHINGYSINTNYGMQLDIVANNWQKALRFDGLCSDIGNDFDIVVYRTGTVKRAMFGLMSALTGVNPSIGSNYHQRQYIGQWNTGGRTQSAYGSQRYEVGGVTWNQAYTRIDTPAGEFIRYHFKNAGQNGNIVEIWQVDAALNDIALLRSYTSNKPSTPATVVCPSVIPREDGLSDYFITAIRYE